MTEPRWYAVHTKPRLEERASYYLRRQGYRTFYPFTRETKFMGRKLGPGGKPHQGRRVVVESPLFSRYIFVALVRHRDNLFDVNETYGVSTTVRTPSGEPLEIPAPVITSLMSITDLITDEEDPKAGCHLVVPERRAGLLKVTRKEHPFKGKPGDMLQMKDRAPLYGLCVQLASIAHLDDRGEISIFLDMFGKNQEVPVSVDEVARIIAA